MIIPSLFILEQKSSRPWNNAHAFPANVNLALATQHCVCLAAARLSISENRSLISL